MKRLELRLSVFALSFILTPLVCLACDCPYPTVTQERQTAAAIFSGKATRIAETTDSKYIQITFKVEQSWKGAPTREKSLFRDNVLTDCDFGFQVGAEYLVYAHGDPKKLSTNTCTRTRRLVDAAADINELAEPLRVEPLESLIALMKKSPEVFTQDETETQEEYFSKLRSYFNKTELNGKKLKDTFFLLKTDFTYDVEEQEFTTDRYLLNVNYNIVSRVHGVYSYGFPKLSLKVPPEKAAELKPYLRLAVNALPITLVSSERVRLLPVKYVIYDDRDKKVLATISTENDIGSSDGSRE